jgi:hypothetical protein
MKGAYHQKIAILTNAAFWFIIITVLLNHHSKCRVKKCLINRKITGLFFFISIYYCSYASDLNCPAFSNLFFQTYKVLWVVLIEVTHFFPHCHWSKSSYTFLLFHSDLKMYPLLQLAALIFLILKCLVCAGLFQMTLPKDSPHYPLLSE